jgi:hypothetical protein
MEIIASGMSAIPERWRARRDAQRSRSKQGTVSGGSPKIWTAYGPQYHQRRPRQRKICRPLVGCPPKRWYRPPLGPIVANIGAEVEFSEIGLRIIGTGGPNNERLSCGGVVKFKWGTCVRGVSQLFP